MDLKKGKKGTKREGTEDEKKPKIDKNSYFNTESDDSDLLTFDFYTFQVGLKAIKV